MKHQNGNDCSDRVGEINLFTDGLFVMQPLFWNRQTHNEQIHFRYRLITK